MRYCRGCSTTHTYGIIWKDTRTNHVRRLHTPPPFIYVTDTVVFLYVVFCVVLCMQVYHILRNTLYTYIVCSRAYNLNTFMCTGVPWVFTEGTCNARKMFFFKFYVYYHSGLRKGVHNGTKCIWNLCMSVMTLFFVTLLEYAPCTM